MALNIKDEETDRLARELAREAHESITVATRIALEERLARIRGTNRPSVAEPELRGIIERGRARATYHARHDAEPLGYDHQRPPGRHPPPPRPIGRPQCRERMCAYG